MNVTITTEVWIGFVIGFLWGMSLTNLVLAVWMKNWKPPQDTGVGI